MNTVCGITALLIWPGQTSLHRAVFIYWHLPAQPRRKADVPMSSQSAAGRRFAEAIGRVKADAIVARRA